MADQMFLVITLRKPVDDRQEGETLYNLVKTRLEDKPEIKITGHVTNHFEFQEDPS